MTALREIFASFGIEFDSSRRLEKGNVSVDGMTTRLKQLGSVIAGSFIVNGIKNFVGETLRMADDLDKVSQQLGLTIRELQGFQHAAQIAGVDAAAFNRSIGQLQYNAQNAANGEASMSRAFRQLGIDVRDANGSMLPGSELLRRVADGMRDTENPTARMALAMRLMGESGRRMLPMLTGGRAGLDEMVTELDRLGGGISRDFVSSAVNINDELTRFRVALLGARSALILFFLPAAQRVVGVLTRVAAFLGQNKGLANALGVSFVALGVAASGAALKAMAAWIAAGWPILLAAAAVAVLYLAVQDLWVTWQGGDSLLRRFINDLFPGVVDGLDATDRGILSVVTAIETLITIFGTLADIVAPLGDVLAIPLQPLFAIAGAIDDIARGLGILQVASRFLGRSTRTAWGTSLLGEDPEQAGIAGRLAAQRRGLSVLGTAITGGNTDTQQRQELRAQIGPQRLAGNVLKGAARTNIDARSNVSIAIHDAGVVTPGETARLVRRGVREELDKQARAISNAVVEAPSTS